MRIYFVYTEGRASIFSLEHIYEQEEDMMNTLYFTQSSNYYLYKFQRSAYSDLRIFF
jgi:hypothetical protein